MKLFCFTHAGGTADFYNPLDDIFADYDTEIVKIEYAGHGKRYREPFYKDFDELSSDMISILKNNLESDDNYAMFGYSMGSISVTETLRKISLSNEIPMPHHVFIAAHEPFSGSGFPDPENGFTDKYIKEMTIRFGGIPEKLINNNSFWRFYLPVYKADYQIIRNYDFDNLDFETEIPLSVFYSESDTPLHKMKKWSRFFAGPCWFEKYCGNHFFIKEHWKEIADIIKERLNFNEIR
ncbi:MAG: thioesterase II family protein [Porcipelethomonas sp.]